MFGGAASGKSSFAERLLRSAGRPLFYIATAQAFDAEMAAKIDAHKTARATDGWTTIEEPMDVASVLARISSDGVVLLDCATVWLSNIMLQDADLLAAEDRLLNALSAASLPIVVVSNETGQGIVPDNKLARTFREAQGKLNQRLAAQADLVVHVTVGLPQVLKGQLPEGVV